MRRQNIIRLALPPGQFPRIRPSRLPQRFLQVLSLEPRIVFQVVYQGSLEARCEDFAKICQILSTVIIQFVYCGNYNII